MNNKKAEIKIENFTTIFLHPQPSAKLQNSDQASELASFRIQMEGSSNQSSPMNLPQISPIKAIIQPHKNFTTESEKFEALYPNFIKLMPSETDEENEDIEKSIKFLVPNLKKSKFIQCTPTFPIKPEENAPWSENSNPPPEKQAGDSSDVSLDKFAQENGPGTVSELPTLLDDQIFMHQEKTVESEPKSKENNEKGVNDESCSELEQNKVEKEEKKDFVKTGLVRKEYKKVKHRAVSHLRFKPEPRLSVSGSEVALTKTQVVSTSLDKPPVEKTRAKSIGKIRMKDFEVKQGVKVKSSMKKLPELREQQTRPNARHQVSPYKSDWNKNSSMLHFNTQLKKHKEAGVIKNLVTKVVKKKKIVMK